MHYIFLKGKELNESDDEDNLDVYTYSTDEHGDDSHPKTLRYKNGITLKLRKKRKIISYVRNCKQKYPDKLFPRNAATVYSTEKRRKVNEPIW